MSEGKREFSILSEEFNGKQRPLVAMKNWQGNPFYTRAVIRLETASLMKAVDRDYCFHCLNIRTTADRPGHLGHAGNTAGEFKIAQRGDNYLNFLLHFNALDIGFTQLEFNPQGG